MILTNAIEATDYSDCVRDLHRVGIAPQSYINGLDAVCVRFVPSVTGLIPCLWDLRRLMSFRPNLIFASDACGRSVMFAGYMGCFRTRTMSN